MRNLKIVITGASSGIGRATAVRLGREGATIALVARREERLKEVADQIHRDGGVAHVQAVDLLQEGAAGAMIEAAYQGFGRIDVLINNAAFGYFGSIENMPPGISREIFGLNFEAPLAAIQRVIPIMRKQGSGHIINVSSVAGKRGLPLSGIYCATKFALNGLSESLRGELAGSGIHVTLINPTYTRSEFQEALRKGDVAGQFAPVGRVQTSEEVAETIVRCIRHPKIEVYPYALSRAVVWASALAPSLMDKVILRAFRERLRARTMK